MKANGTSLTQLTSGSSNEAQPFWGIDGYIYFASTAGARRPDGSTGGKKKLSLGQKIRNKVKGNEDQTEDKTLAAFSYPYSDIWRVKPIIMTSNHGGSAVTK